MPSKKIIDNINDTISLIKNIIIHFNITERNKSFSKSNKISIRIKGKSSAIIFSTMKNICENKIKDTATVIEHHTAKATFLFAR